MPSYVCQRVLYFHEVVTILIYYAQQIWRMSFVFHFLNEDTEVQWS